jgi:hypothetical protein
MNEERTGKCLRLVELIRSHLWHRYSIAVNQVVVATVNFSKWWPMSTSPTVLHTKKEYGMIIFVPIKKKKKWHERRHDRIFFKRNNHDWYFPRFKQVSLHRDFAQKSWENLKLLRYSIKVLKSLSKNV